MVIEIDDPIEFAIEPKIYIYIYNIGPGKPAAEVSQT